MNLAKQIDREHLASIDSVNCVAHRIDISEDLGCGDVARFLAVSARSIGAKKPTRTNFEALDLGRIYRLGAQQQTRERFGIGQGLSAAVEFEDRSLGVGNIRGFGPGEYDGTPDQGIRHVGFVAAAFSVAIGEA